MSMFARTASTLRNGGRTFLRQHQQQQMKPIQRQQRRTMGGGAHWLSVSKTHTRLGEAFGFVCWMWIFHRTRCDGPVVMGWRHPWEHAEDPWAHARGGDGHGHGDGHGGEAHAAEE